MLLIFPKVYWKHRRLSTHLAQISIWTTFSFRPSIHHFSSSNLHSFFLPSQSRPLAEQLLSLRRQRRPWRWRGNRHLEMYSTTALPTNPSQEGASWRPRCPVATPRLCWDALLPSPLTTSLFCQSTVLEKGKQDKEKEQHVRWFIIHRTTNIALSVAKFRKSSIIHHKLKHLISCLCQ